MPRTPSQQGSRSGMDGQTPEVSNMPQQQPQQQQANVSQNVQGFASTTNLNAGGQVGPVQGCQQGNVPECKDRKLGRFDASGGADPRGHSHVR